MSLNIANKNSSTGDITLTRTAGKIPPSFSELGSGLQLSNNKLDVSTSVTQKISKLDSDGKIAYSDVKNTPTIPTVPTNVSAFNNDSGYITDSSLDEWHKYNGSVEINTVTSASTSTSITFHGLDTNKAYDLYFETTDGSFPTLESASLSGTELTYSVKVATVPANFKLRVIK